MNLTLNTERTFWAVTTVHFKDEAGKAKKGSFEAEFKVLPADKIEGQEETRVLDLVLASVKEDQLNITDGTGQKLSGKELLEALKNDPAVSTALMSTYSAEVAKKNLRKT